MSIYVITHKEFNDYLKTPIYKPLLVGANKNSGPDHYLKDNSIEDNISNKNESFCELTGQYWIWKSSKDDVIGLCHYRRYFTKNSKFFSKSFVPSETEILDFLSKYDIILPVKRQFYKDGQTAKEFFYNFHDPDVWENCRELIRNNCPEYLSSFEWFENEKEGYCYNMLISNREIFDNYSKWLFDILFELEKNIDLSKYDNYNKRMIGFVSERLINVWVHKNQLSVKELPVVFTEPDLKIKKLLKNL
ncbi:DUF4422 domain-containing protein [Streptococcus suis]|uniref:DUF4422 domain-containing protein n=1 Tax=Streptococcus suis TaxID=1307 RepID=UPI000CF63FA7|nr:DUF4422 domain-containing protein [Streptococcus suis]